MKECELINKMLLLRQITVVEPLLSKLIRYGYHHYLGR